MKPVAMRVKTGGVVRVVWCESVGVYTTACQYVREGADHVSWSDDEGYHFVCPEHLGIFDR